ncbi:hypothetical protein JCM13664_13750 [Methylothermus subterraneus]
MRKFAKTLAVVGAITPAGVNALGLGEIRLHSALNQRLLAEIPILASGEDVSQIRVGLASAEAFAKAGLPRPYYLADLRFKPIRKADGSFVIRVTSNEVMREPFLDFLLEVDWPEGRMLREFTVLLDPPVFLAEAGEPAPKSVRPAEAAIGQAAEYGPVRRGESLWAIADRLKPSAITTEQMAIALLQTNPEAFAEPNVNALKAGAILKIPSQEALAGLSPEQARREFQRQYQTWLAKRASAPESRAEQTPEPQLKLEAPKEAPSQVESSEAAPALETQAALEALRQENADLKSRIEALEAQVAALAELAKASSQAENSSGAASAAPSEAAPIQATPESAVSLPPETPLQTAPSNTVPLAEPKPEVAPEPVEKPAEEPSPPSEWLSPWYLSLGGGSLLLLGIAGWMIWQRRQAAQVQADSLLAEMDQHAGQESESEVAAASASAGMNGTETVESSFLSEFTPSDFDVLEGESAAVDPLAEADVYLAYGRYQQAEELIRQALLREPERPELRLKLLEIFYAKEDATGFAGYAQELKDQGADQEPDFWEKVVDMGRELCPESPLFKSNEAAVSESAWELKTESTSLEGDRVLEFDLDGLDLKTSKASSQDKKLEEDDSSTAFSLVLEDLTGSLVEEEIALTEDNLPKQPAASESFDLSDQDELDTKLDLARAYVEMEDVEAAKEILEEVVSHGSENQKQEAKILLDKLGLTS